MSKNKDRDDSKDIQFPTRKNAHPDGWGSSRKAPDSGGPSKRPETTESGWPLGNRWTD